MLYFVGTPIGNLKDMSLRAISVLNEVDEIACEDTRHSLGLLNAYDIKKPLVSYHKFNERQAGEKIIEKLKSGKNIAVISDAGMPLISDPGNILEWIIARCEGKVDAVETPIGFVPKAEDINVEGLEDVNLDTIKELLTVDKENWKAEAEGIEGFYGELTRVPDELYSQLATLKDNLNK